MSLSNVPKLQELYFHPWKLPIEILTLVDDQFYSFIEYLVGSTLSNLLRVQEINSVPILLLTTDVFEHLFLKINDVETDLLRQELLLKIDNNNLIFNLPSKEIEGWYERFICCYPYGYVSFQEFLIYLKQLNIYRENQQHQLFKSLIEQLFYTLDVNNDKQLNFEEFFQFNLLINQGTDEDKLKLILNLHDR
ncbi:unnamed protein product [Rotaria sordida]|uniref:EF-hand domain-containing protein n=2 Tax=Rotaria sordida TaxID=392033 RepID=A0A815CFZ9_9BILA|nr:unnamed protein product [Rotaria sordida]